MKATLKKLELRFINPARTSRGILFTKPSWYFFIQHNDHTGVGECSVIPGLNPEYNDYYEKKVLQVATQLNSGWIPRLQELDDFPTIRFGLECAYLDLKNKKEGILFPSSFTRGEAGISINGLIWMGSIEEIRDRITQKLKEGYRVLKLKVGAHDFKEEMELLKNIRTHYKSSDLEIRLDANGAYSPEKAFEHLCRFAEIDIHSIEQPIKAGQWDEMAHLCGASPLPIALDEELIGIQSEEQISKLLGHIHPQYIILKPSILGGLEKSDVWIKTASTHNINWWATSALESNVGLNAIAQWVAIKNPSMVQGLGTGQLYMHNIPSPLYLNGGTLYFNQQGSWDYSQETNNFISFVVP